MILRARERSVFEFVPIRRHRYTATTVAERGEITVKKKAILKVRHLVYESAISLLRRVATTPIYFASIICCGLLTCGCGKAGANGDGIPANAVHLGTNSVGLVSIGVLNEVDLQKQIAVTRFFASNEVTCFIEGSVMFDVLVYQKDVERVRAILKTNKPPGVAFRSAWESH